MTIIKPLSKYRYFMSFLARIFGKGFGNQVMFLGFVYDYPDKKKSKKMKQYLKGMKKC